MEKDILPDDNQKRVLCEMVVSAFIEIRALAREMNATQIEDLADTFHNIPQEMNGVGLWSRELTRGSLANYQAKYHAETYLGKHNYVKMFDDAFDEQP